MYCIVQNVQGYRIAENFTEEYFAISRSNKHFAVLILQFVCYVFCFFVLILTISSLARLKILQINFH